MNSRRFIANLAPDASQPDRKQFFGKGPSVRMSGPGAFASFGPYPVIKVFPEMRACL
jgi:hypothetical protein